VEAVVFRMKDYLSHTQTWWQQWHGVRINDKLLSRFGVAICEGAKPLAIGYIYPSQCADICFMGFTVRDPNLSRYKAGKALKLLIEACETEVKKLGYPILYTTYDSPALHRLVEKRGYYKGSAVQEYFKELK
jgi:hypothetical protein